MAGQRVAITGSSGLIGTALTAHLTARGDRVLHLVRRASRGPDERTWYPERSPGGETLFDPRLLRGVDCVVHLAGESIAGRRWSPEQKKRILQSRINGTALIAQAVARQDRPVRFVSASAIGFYGTDRGDEVLDESAAPGDGFLAEVVGAWEHSTRFAAEGGQSVALARTGLVVSPRGGAFLPLLRLARLGVAGPLGSGRQWWSWITLPDQVRALTRLLDDPALVGPINLVGPEPARHGEIVRAIGAAVHRPTVLRVPTLALRVAIGEAAGEVVGSLRVVPGQLRAAGFTFTNSTMREAVDYLAAG